MVEPFKPLVAAVLRNSPLALLSVGIAISLTQLATFYLSAKYEGVLFIPAGVGFLTNFGLLSTIVGNAFLPFVVRNYYEQAEQLIDSDAVERKPLIAEGLSELKAMLLLKGRFRFALYGYAFIGALFWTANLGVHIFGDPSQHWGNVFDSINHPMDFYLNRLNNFYAWVIILPLCAHMTLLITLQLVRIVTHSADSGALKYDLLNSDGCGGFVTVERAHLLLNLIFAIIYVQIALHTLTFERLNPEHLIAYVAATLFFVFGNTFFFGGVRRRLKKLRLVALKMQKDRVYRKDSLSLEILKFFYEHKKHRFQFLDIATKIAAVVLPLLMRGAFYLFSRPNPYILL